MTVPRRLAAILAADVVGYSRLMEADEIGTFERLRAHRTELFEPQIAIHHGRVFKLTGDGLLAEFSSVIDAVQCAIAIQRGMAQRNNDVSRDRLIRLRIGVNLGDVIIEGEDRHGEGVNIAARLQQLAEPGGIAISCQAHDHVETKLDLAFEDLGEHPVKNIAKPVHVYHVRDATVRTRGRWTKGRFWRQRTPVAMLAVVAAIAVWYQVREGPIQTPGPSIVLLPFVNAGGTPCDEAFGHGLVRDIGAALLRFGNVSVVSGSPTEGTADRKRDAGDLGYKLSGSIECSADKLRVTAQLFDVDGGQLASEVQDMLIADANILSARAALAGRLAGGIASPTTPLWQFEEDKIEERLKKDPNELLRIYRCILLSYAYYDSFAAEAHKAARDCLEGAIAVVNSDALAWARLGAMYFEEHKYGHNPRPGRDPLTDARDAAQRAIEIDPGMADGYYVLALVYYYIEEDFDSFRETANKAIAKNPYNGWIIGDLGVWNFYSGDWDRGTAQIEAARAIYPDDPRWLDFPAVLNHYRKGEYREAKAAAHALELSRNAMVQEVLAATYGQLGEIDKARRKIDEILETHPEIKANPRAPFLARKIPDELIESLMDGLRKAGLPI